MKPDRLFSDARLAQLLDLFWEGRKDIDFYLPLVMSAPTVLDVGCGTGMLLRRAREAGHAGRLCGLDPASGVLDQARKRSDIEWILGDLASVRWDREFELVVMTGHTFQVFVTDRELRTVLAAIRSVLIDDGRFAFETRNPLVRAWEQWMPQIGTEVTTSAGAVVRMERKIEAVEGDLVSFTHTFTSSAWDRPEVSRSTLRFLDAASVACELSAAGFVIEEQFGDWTRRELTATSPEIITIARRRAR